MYDSVLVEKQGNLAIVTLNRPEALNAFNAALRQDLTAVMRDLNDDDAVQGLVLTEIKLSGVTLQHDGVTISMRVGHGR